MADTDVLGFLSLLLAVAGGAYLVRSRASRPRTETKIPDVDMGHDRAAETMPPLLRPEAELSPKMLAKREALVKQSSRPPPAIDVETGGGPPPDVVERSPERSAGDLVNVGADVAPPAAAARSGSTSDVRPPPKQATSSSSAEGAERPRPSTPTDAFEAENIDREIDREEEEDEELEPTKVGRAATAANIKAIVDKIVFDEGAETPPDGSSTPRLTVHALGQTDPGKRRKQNEDSFLLLEEQTVFVVADGMGGHRGGQHASKLAVKTIGEAFQSRGFAADLNKTIPLEAAELACAMQMANSAIFNEAKRRPELTGMGTTLCAARFTADKQRLYIGHVGDSRCYRVRDGVMKQMTTDHTMADYGVAGPEGGHLSRAIGVWPAVPIDIIMAVPKAGDVYLLCSDGLTRMVPDGTIATQLLHEEDPKAAVDRLIFFANAAGGKDNITMILLRVVEQA